MAANQKWTPDRQRIHRVFDRWVDECLSPYELPAEIRFLAHFPAGSTGKVLEHVLRHMERQPG